LAGIGFINGSLVVSPGAILSPAGTNITLGITSGANAIGTISVSNAIILAGTVIVKLDGSGINDDIQSIQGGITYGGSLSLVNIGPTPLAAGNSFQIFNANHYAGAFTNIIPATPGAGLVWDTTQLNIGKLSIAAAPSQPVLNDVVLLGGDLIFSGTNGVTNGSYVVLTSTNLTAPLISWTALLTNDFNPDGTFHVTNIISLDAPQRFYRLQLH
jgi:hypothetical protein